jgi:FAD/FMN-containing dehydrogenase
MKNVSVRIQQQAMRIQQQEARIQQEGAVAGAKNGIGGVGAGAAAGTGVSTYTGSCELSVQAGAQWAHVYEALGDKAFIVGGGCGTVGVGGYTLGGGIGYLSRVYGLAVDNVLSYQVVTATGSLVTASRSQHPSLFWALSGGGGGNFGVLVSVDFRCHTPPSRYVVGGSFVWNFDRHDRKSHAPNHAQGTLSLPQAKEVLSFYAKWAAELPDAMTAYLAITTQVIGITFFFVGPQNEAEILTAGWRTLFARRPSLSPTTVDPLRSMRFLDFEKTQQGPGLGDGRRNAMSSAMLPALTNGTITMLLDIVSRCPAGGNSSAAAVPGAFLMHLGGAVGRVAANETAFPHRDTQWVVGVEALWESASQDGAYLRWAESVTAQFRRAGHGAYVNYADPRLGSSFGTMYYGSNLQRLRDIKCTYDQSNYFAFAQAVRCPSQHVADGVRIAGHAAQAQGGN